MFTGFASINDFWWHLTGGAPCRWPFHVKVNSYHFKNCWSGVLLTYKFEKILLSNLRKTSEFSRQNKKQGARRSYRWHEKFSRTAEPILQLNLAQTLIFGSIPPQQMMDHFFLKRENRIFVQRISIMIALLKHVNR